MDDEKNMNPKEGGRYIRRDGELVQVEGPAKDPNAEAWQRYEETQKPIDDALVANAIEALSALEARMEEMEPGITSDRDNVLPEMATRWKFDGFPQAALAVLFHMMKKGHTDLVAGASEWKIHRDTIRSVREVYPERYPGEPLRQALVEHGYSRHHNFPPPTSSTDTIDENFVTFAKQKVASLGEGAIKPDTPQAVSALATEEKHIEIANHFYTWRHAYPGQFQKTPTGYERASEKLEQLGYRGVSADTIKSAVEKAPNSIWADMRIWGIKDPTRRKKVKNS
ncbi:hypothetical protein [Salinicola salarius]|uniref:hypothetical protein n=1 Tax=Salinicola salarius TaxID=430457 RepID=UPI000B406DA8|nr:hypothetical protein [Salinicola salarius]